MADLSNVPQTVNLNMYGGDTFTFKVIAPSALVEGKEWLAQIRSTRESDAVDALFVITEPTVADGPAFLTLPSAETKRLVGIGTGAAMKLKRVVKDGVALMMATYSGVWDCQVSGVGGIDPVNTLAQGAVSIEIDVSRAP